MKTNEYKPRVPDIFEAIFDIGYLTFDLIAGVIFLVKADGRSLFVLYGILTLVLCGGDAFHLLPRVKRALGGPGEKVRRQMCRGLQISSITMTIFYVILLYIWRSTFPEIKPPRVLEVLIWASALVRIVLCLLPQNHWLSEEGNIKLSYLRNGVFSITGIGVVILYLISGNAHDYHLTRMAVAILISFGCYFPVVWGAKKKPMLGMLMIPKTCAYMWMIVMGLNLLKIV